MAIHFNIDNILNSFIKNSDKCIKYLFRNQNINKCLKDYIQNCFENNIYMNTIVNKCKKMKAEIEREIEEEKNNDIFSLD